MRNKTENCSVTETFGDMYISADEEVYEEILKLFKKLKRKLRIATLDFEIERLTDSEKYNATFRCLTINSLRTMLAYLYDNREGINWELLKNSNYEITLDYDEWSPNIFGDFIRKVETKIVHLEGEQVNIPRIEDVTCEQVADTWGNRLKYNVNESLEEILNEELEAIIDSGMNEEDALYQVAFALLKEKGGLENYFKKSLSQIYESEIVQKGHDNKKFQTIFNVLSIVS